MAKADAPGEHITLIGQVYDGNGHLVRDSFLELWQADHLGHCQPDFDLEKPFNGFARTATTFDAGVELSLSGELSLASICSEGLAPDFARTHRRLLRLRALNVVAPHA